MNSSRNKKLLASFLTALGLSMNSANVSADFNAKQFLSNARFACKVLGGQKAEEKNKLDNWVNEVYRFISNPENNNNNEVFFRSYLNLCNEFQTALQDIRSKRNNSSKLFNKLSADDFLNAPSVVINLSSNSTSEIEINDVQKWLNKFIKADINGGYFTIWDTNMMSKIREAAKKLYSAAQIKLADKKLYEEAVAENSDYFSKKKNSDFKSNLPVNQQNINISNNSTQYKGKYYYQNYKLISNQILDSYKDKQSMINQTVNPKYTFNWLIKMFFAVSKHGIDEIEGIINNNNNFKYKNEILKLKRYLCGDCEIGNFKIQSDVNYGLIFKINNGQEAFLFAVDGRNVNVSYNSYDAGSNNLAFFLVPSSYFDKYPIILCFELPEKYASDLNPMKKQNVVPQNFDMNQFNKNYPNNMMQMNNNNFNQINQNYLNNQLQQGFNNRFVSNNQFNNNGNWQ